MLRNFDTSRVIMKEELGRGGFGKVYPYAKRDQTFDDYCVKMVSMKEKPPIEEILVGYQIKHPFAIPILGYHIEKPKKEGGEWKFYLKMKRMKESVKDLIDRKGYPPSKDEIVKCMFRLASALAYLQSKDIAHRDVKPNNILLDKQGNAYISDFGLCTSMIEKEQTLVFVVNGVAGTEMYLDPELKKKESGFVPDDLYRGDAWSLGLTMLDICLFDVKGNGHISSLQDKLKKISEKYDSNLEAIISRLLTKDAEKRMTFSEVCETLQKHYGPVLEETIEILQEEVQQSESIQKKVREQNEERLTTLFNAIIMLSCDFSQEFRFHFAKGKLSISAKNRPALSDEALRKLSNALKDNLDADCFQTLMKAIDIDLSLCPKITDEGLSYLDFLSCSRDHIEEFSLGLFGCTGISGVELFLLLTNEKSILKELKSFKLNMAGCKNFSTPSFMLLPDVLGNFKKLKSLNLNFSGCQDIKLTEPQIEEFSSIIKEHLKNLQEFTLDLSQTGSDCQKTRVLIEKSLKKSVNRVVVY